MYSLRAPPPSPMPGLRSTRLLCGSGMCSVEAMRLRIKDVDVDRQAIVVRDGKGDKDRVGMLPSGLVAHA